MPVKIHSTPASLTALPRGRAAGSRPDPRFLQWQRSADEASPPGEQPTRLFEEQARSVISYNSSPDVPFDRSINPYRGCEHGCIYCFARPSHAYLDLSPGLDFETRIHWKANAAEILRRELSRPAYRCAPIALGVNTDAWQPAERQLGLSRQILQVLLAFRHPVSIITKSALIERDLDLLGELAAHGLVRVMFSITTLDDALARRLEPRAPRGERRLQAMRTLHEAGVPVGVLFAPLIPALNDHEMEAILQAARAAGADQAAFILLRLPRELAQLFEDWLHTHYPQRAAHVLSLLRQCRDGALNDPRFGERMRGSGVFARLYRQRLHKAALRLGLDPAGGERLRCDLFRVPPDGPVQASLF